MQATGHEEQTFCSTDSEAPLSLHPETQGGDTQHLTQTLHQVQEEHYALKCQRLAVCAQVPSEWAGPPELRRPRGRVLLETGAVRAGFLGDEGGSGFQRVRAIGRGRKDSPTYACRRHWSAGWAGPRLGMGRS